MAETPFVTGQSLGSIRNNYGDYVGFAFTVGAADITVTQLGRWVVSGNTETHYIAIFDSDSVIVDFVQVNTSGATPGQFLYGTLDSPVVLTSGLTYFVMSDENESADEWYDEDTTVTTTAAGTVTDGAYMLTGVCTTSTAGSRSFGPVNFKYLSGQSIAAGLGSFALTGTAATTLHGWKVAASAGSFTLTGTAATLRKGWKAAAVAGSFVLTGTAASTIHAWKAAAGAGSFALTGTAASPLYGWNVAANAGSFALTGTAATALHAKKVAAGAGSYVLSGTDAALTLESSGAFVLAAGAGSFALTGTAATLLHAWKIAAGSGSFALTGTDASLLINSPDVIGFERPRTPIELMLASTAGPWGRLFFPRMSGGFGFGGGTTGSGLAPAPAPAGSDALGYRPAPLAEAAPSNLRDAASARWVSRVVDTVNNSLRGKLNVTLNVTLDANAASTIIVDSRISAFSALIFVPLTSNASAEQASGGLYVSAQKSGEAMVAHASNAQADRVFRLVILA